MDKDKTEQGKALSKIPKGKKKLKEMLLEPSFVMEQDSININNNTDNNNGKNYNVI